ncbi:hypothetical protein HY772_09340 [Candidatus Woesearchaeota archaeon]|nr:hypothetical protein [Candidatus Woesearchaeota archaeon]
MKKKQKAKQKKENIRFWLSTRIFKNQKVGMIFTFLMLLVNIPLIIFVTLKVGVSGAIGLTNITQEGSRQILWLIIPYIVWASLIVFFMRKAVLDVLKQTKLLDETTVAKYKKMLNIYLLIAVVASLVILITGIFYIDFSLRSNLPFTADWTVHPAMENNSLINQTIDSISSLRCMSAGGYFTRTVTNDLLDCQVPIKYAQNSTYYLYQISVYTHPLSEPKYQQFNYTDDWVKEKNYTFSIAVPDAPYKEYRIWLLFSNRSTTSKFLTTHETLFIMYNILSLEQYTAWQYKKLVWFLSLLTFILFAIPTGLNAWKKMIENNKD